VALVNVGGEERIALQIKHSMSAIRSGAQVQDFPNGALWLHLVNVRHCWLDQVVLQIRTRHSSASDAS
jgi:hypothetical protein